MAPIRRPRGDAGGPLSARPRDAPGRSSPARLWLAGALGLCATVAFTGCGGGGCGAGERALAEVEVAGCTSFRRAPDAICLTLPETVLTLAVRAEVSATVTVAPSGEELAASAGGWRRFRVGPDLDASRLTVEVDDGDGRSAWSLALGRFEEAPAVAEAQRARAAREFDRALTLVETALRSPSLDGRAKARLVGLRARVRIAQGAMAAAEAELREALHLDREHGLVSDATRDSMALAWVLIDGLKLDDAAEVLTDLERFAHGYDEAPAQIAFNRASLHRRAGRQRDALRALDDAEVIAVRLGLDTLHAQVQQSTANVLQEVGRFEESSAILQGLVDLSGADGDPCARATLLTNLGWARLAVVEAGGEATTLPVLREALKLWRSECASPPEVGNALVNLSLAHLQGGRVREAREHLREATAAGAADSAVIEAWRLDLDGRIALAEGRTDAAASAFEGLAELAREAGVADAALRATLGTAEVLAAQGRNEEALAAWVEADRRLDEALRAVPLGEGLGNFLASATRGPRHHVDLLMTLERPAEALEVARRARTREVTVLRRLRALSALGPEARVRWEAAVATWRTERQALDAAAQEDWKLAADRRAAAAQARVERERKLRQVLDDALAIVAPESSGELGPAAAAGELTLAAHPGVRGLWLFGATEGAVRGVHLDALPRAPDAMSAALLEPFRAELARATTLRILPYGALREVDFHALPWDGRPLGASRPLAYAVDLPHLPGAPASDAPAALVVADPARNLAGALAEVDAVRALLRGDATAPTVMDAASATLAAVQERLPHVGLFHFAGHGWFGGLGGWESALGLASGQRLTVGDILALPRVPATVVLSGCETGRSDRGGPGATLGLGEAFVISGAEAVIAATRPVDDALAAAVSVALYADGRAALARDPAAALQRAQATVRAALPDADWASFRLIVP
ncbi:MAG: CHAT domain-containing protein [Myxococcota bacterium]